MKNVNDSFLGVALLVLLVVMLYVRATAQQFEFKGVYTVQQVLITYCEDCFLELPPDYLKAEIVLSVTTDDERRFFRAVQTSSQAVGWSLERGKSGKLRAEPMQNVGNMVYISCMDYQPHNVPKYLYSASVKADKIQCDRRDSLAMETRRRAVSDSMKMDSVSRSRLDFRGYQLRYYAYSKSFTDKLGLDWSSVVAGGNMHSRLDFFDDWRLYATKTNDTSYNERSVIFSVDSIISLDWGSEEQTIKKTFVNDGVTTSDYEWRKYGLLITVKRDGRRVKMDYVFRDKDNSVSVLQGSVIGLEGDTLRLVGHYNSKRQVETGVPFLSTVPILGNLFKSNQSVVDSRVFELYLLPQQPRKGAKDDEWKNDRSLSSDGKTSIDTTEKGVMVR